MTDISKDLAALRIPQEERGGRRAPLASSSRILVIGGLVAGGDWYWTTQMQTVAGQDGARRP